MKIEVIKGVGGPSIYINNIRIAGEKPWGGGAIIYSWECSKEDILQAIESEGGDE